MALPGEINDGKMQVKCSECGTMLKLEVLYSGAGYYLGYMCPECGPYARESEYMTKGEAYVELAKIRSGMSSTKLRTTAYHG